MASTGHDAEPGRAAECGPGPGSGTTRRRWFRWAALVAVLVALVVGGGALLMRDRVTTVTIDDALEQFSATTASTTTRPTSTLASPTTVATSTTVAAPSTSIGVAAPELPRPGVYRYTGSGSESVDALSGATHEYPAETAVIVSPAGCGVEIRWTPFEERNESWQMCVVDGGIAVVSYRSTHEFFGTGDSRTLTCDEPAWLIPPAGDDGDLEATCTGDDLTEVRTTRVVGTRSVEVGGRTVDSVDVEVTVATSGLSTGTTIRRLLLDASSGLPLRWSDDVRNRSGSPIGDVNYTETFTLTLASLDPVS